MIIPDLKKAQMTIMARRAPNGGERLSGPAPMKVDSVKNEAGEPDGRHVASQDVMAAMHEKSPEKLMTAMSNFIELHHSRANQE